MDRIESKNVQFERTVSKAKISENINCDAPKEVTAPFHSKIHIKYVSCHPDDYTNVFNYRNAYHSGLYNFIKMPDGPVYLVSFFVSKLILRWLLTLF